MSKFGPQGLGDELQARPPSGHHQPHARQSASTRVADSGLVDCSSRNVTGRKPCESLHSLSRASSTLAPVAASLSALSPWCLLACSAQSILCSIPRPSLAHSKAKNHPANTALELSLKPRSNAVNHHHHHVGQAHPVCRTTQRNTRILTDI
jgi:hypothetical protein